MTIELKKTLIAVVEACAALPDQITCTSSRRILVVFDDYRPLKAELAAAFGLPVRAGTGAGMTSWIWYVDDIVVVLVHNEVRISA